MDIFVVKRKGHKEQFDERKIYASVYAASLSCQYTEEESESISENVCKEILEWLTSHPTLTSHQLKIKVVNVGIAGQHIRSLQHRGMYTRKDSQDDKCNISSTQLRNH